jgi:hypothetical protein
LSVGRLLARNSRGAPQSGAGQGNARRSINAGQSRFGHRGARTTATAGLSQRSQGSNPAPATIVMSQDISDTRTCDCRSGWCHFGSCDVSGHPGHPNLRSAGSGVCHFGCGPGGLAVGWQSPATRKPALMRKQIRAGCTLGSLRLTGPKRFANAAIRTVRGVSSHCFRSRSWGAARPCRMCDTSGAVRFLRM